MSKSTQERGSVLPLTLTIIAVFLITAGAVYYLTRKPAIAPTPNESTSPVNQTGTQTSPPRSTNPTSTTYTGAVLAGTNSPLLDFAKADFDKALQSNKLVVLYFYANWCPICRAEFPKMQAAFNELTTDHVIAFRVNFNDNETDDDEKALARQHGVAYQHTKVFVRNNQQVLKSPESWEKNRYLTEITNALK